MLAVGSEHRLPGEYARHADGAENAAQNDAGEDFASDDAEPVAHDDFAQRHGTDDERCRLRAGVSAAADDQRQEQRQHHGSIEFSFKVTQGGGCEHFTEKQHRKPAGALLDELVEASLKVGFVQGFHAADLLHVFAGFLIDDVDNIIKRHNSFHALVFTEHRDCKQATL